MLTLNQQDFTPDDIKKIREMCIAHTQGEETWHEFELANGKIIDVDCYDAALIEDEPRGFNMSAYPVLNGKTLTLLPSFDLGEIPYDEMPCYEVK